MMNTLANTPIFMGLTEDDDARTTEWIALNSLTIAFVITAIFTLAGHHRIGLFGQQQLIMFLIRRLAQR